MPDIVTSPTARLARILQLSAFDGDSVEAMRALHGYFAPTMQDCSLAFVQVGGYARGQCRIAGMIDANGVERIANTDPLGVHGPLALLQDGLTTRLFAEPAARILRPNADDIGGAFAAALGSPAALCALPVANTGLVNHWLVFGTANERGFDMLDPDALLIDVNLAANLVIRPLATRALRTETARQREAIEGLADVQRLLLPDNPVILGLDYAVHWQPAETAAGDYYDLVNLTPHAPEGFARERYDIWALTLADVSGHGAAAAMEAVQFDAILRTYQGDEEAGPAGALTYANKYFFSRRQRHHFLTAFALLYRPDLRRATYVAAGHPPLLHKRGPTVIERGAGEQIPLGILRDHVFENSQFDMEPGDTLVFYTDGIIETRNAAQQPFGVERLAALVAEGPADPAALLDLLRTAVIDHQGGPLGVDDQTLIVLRVNHD
jgi:sigma-B regulation protein RsbU (phosphoserine phosphatase)